MVHLLISSEGIYLPDQVLHLCKSIIKPKSEEASGKLTIHVSIISSHQFKGGDGLPRGWFSRAVPSAAGGSQVLGRAWAATLQQAGPWAAERHTSFIGPSLHPLSSQEKQWSRLPGELLLPPSLQALRPNWIKQAGMNLLWAEGCTGDLLRSPPTWITLQSSDISTCLSVYHVQAWGAWK